MTNRQLAAAKTREKLVETAKEIICEKGLSNTSVDEITEKSGVSKGTFYTYFKRKEDIVFELSKGMFAAILENAINLEADFLAKLTNYMVNFSGYIEKGSLKLCQEWVKNVAVPELVEDEEQRGKLQSHLAAVRELFEHGVNTGLLNEQTPITELTSTIVDILYGQMLCWCLSSGSYSYRERTAMFCKEFLPILLKNYIVEGGMA